MEYTHADLDLAIATRAGSGVPPASAIARADAEAAFTTEPRVSIFALCGSLTENRADVPLADLRKIAVALTIISADPFGPLAQRFAPVPGMVR